MQTLTAGDILQIRAAILLDLETIIKQLPMANKPHFKEALLIAIQGRQAYITSLQNIPTTPLRSR